MASSSNETIGELKIKLTFDTSSFEASQRQVEKSAEGTYSVMKHTMGNLMSDVIKSAANEVKQLAQNVVEVGSSFDAAMSKVKAISGATTSEFTALRNKAREMGETTIFSATESAEAFNYMAMAGWDASEMMDGIEGIMNLAAAAGTDLATTSDIVTDALTAMGYSARDSGRFADVMAAASANANTNVEMMGETFKYAASVAGALGYNIEDTATAIGLMANAGIKSTQAGTSLRSILSRLAAPTSDVQAAMGELGISLTDSEGNMKSLDAVMQELRVGFSKLSATQKTEMASTIAGKNAMSGLLAIVNASESDYKKLTTAVNNSTGAAKKMADEMNNNVSGKMKLLKSQLEDIAITIWDKLSPTIMKTIDKVQAALKKVDWGKVANAIGDMFNKLADAFVWVMDHADLVANAIGGVVAAMTTKKVVDFGNSVADLGKNLMDFLNNAPLVSSVFSMISGHIGGVISSIGQFGAGIAAVAAPVAGLTAVVGGIGAAMIGVTAAIKDNMLQMDNSLGAHLRMNAALDESKVYLKTAQKEWETLKTKQDEAVQVGMREIDHYQDLAAELDLIVDKNGKVKAGYENRAKFITSELSKALGTEISYTDGIIDGYDKVRESIKKTIEAKRAELILASQEEIYQKALEARVELSKKITEAAEEQRLAAEQGREEDRIKVAQHLEELKGQYEQYTLTIGQYENNMALYSQEQYSEMTRTIYQYSDDYKNAEEAIKATLLEDVAETTNNLGALQSLYETTGNEIYLKQREIAQAELDSRSEEMNQYFTTTETSLLQVLEAWNTNLEEQLSAITGHSIQFEEAGEGLVNMMVDGVVAKEGLSKESMRKLVDATISEIQTKKQNALASGTGLINGYNMGLNDAAAQAEVFDSARSFGNGVIKIVNETWDEHSPSKVAEASGVNLIRGADIGINNGSVQSSVFASIRSFAAGIVSTFKRALGIHSPSTIMRDVIGKNLAAGIGVGFENEIGEVQKDMQNEVRQLAAGIYAEVPAFDYSTSVNSSALFDGMLADDDSTSGVDSEPLIVNLELDGQQIQQVILQDIRRTV